MGRRKKKKRSLRAASAKVTAKAREQATSKKRTPPAEHSSAQGLGEAALTKPESKPAVALKNPFDRYFFGPVAAARAYLLLRLSLVLLAFDCWVDLIPHAGRYGVGGFNVAHFAILDAVLPSPTPGIYIGTLLVTGWLALVMAVRPAKVGLALLFGLYTYGWSMSMLDSYQHHYLLSLLLFSFIWFPTPAATELFGRTGEGRAPDLGLWRLVGGGLLFFFLGEVTAAGAGLDTPLTAAIGDLGIRIGIRATGVLLGALLIWMVDDAPDAPKLPEGKLTSAWAYVSFCVTCAIVYFYTAITKLEPRWREGHALQELGTSDAFVELRNQAIGEGFPLIGPMEVSEFWELMAAGAIAVQAVSAFGYLASAAQDHFAGWRRLLVAALGLAPLSFHLGAERMGLQIGWFSYYMLLIVFAVFLPIELLRPMGAAFTWPARALAQKVGKRLESSTATWGLLAVATAATVSLTLAIDLPGDGAAAFLMASLLVGGAIACLRRGLGRTARGWGFGALIAGLAMFLSVTETDVRYDYYRFVGGDHRRRGELEEALEAYVKANAYVVHPWCVQRPQTVGECFADEASANRAARREGVEWRVHRLRTQPPFCLVREAEKGDCFRTRERADKRAISLGGDWRVEANDRKAKEEQVRAMLLQQEAADAADEGGADDD